MQSFFFVPANRLHKIPSIVKLNVDEIIIDLEDAIKTSEREEFIHQLKNESIDRSFFIRVPLYSIQNKLELSILEELIAIGYKNFIYPKLQNIQDFERVTKFITEENKIILLIETPLLLTQLQTILDKYNTKIYGIGLGSHDFMNYIGGKHNLHNLEFYRNFTLLFAKAYNCVSFDIASMELEDENELTLEIKDGFNKGFDAKLYIHPWQIAVKNAIQFFNEKDLEWAERIYKEYQKINNPEEFNPIVVDGEIIEKPHLNKVFTILKYFNK